MPSRRSIPFPFGFPAYKPELKAKTGSSIPTPTAFPLIFTYELFTPQNRFPIILASISLH